MKAIEPVVSVYSKLTGVERDYTLTQWAMLPKTARLEWQQGTPPEALKQDAPVQAPAAAMIPSSLEKQIADGVAAALKRLGIVVPEAETPEQIQARKIKEGVAESLRQLGMSEEAILKIQNEDTGEETDAGKQVEVPVEKANPELVKQVTEAAADSSVQHTGVDAVTTAQADATKIEAVRNPVVVAQAAVAANNTVDAAAAVKEITDSAEEGNTDTESEDPHPELTAARKRYEELYPGQKAGTKQLATLQQAISLKEKQ
jgi:hypothetical protein